MNFRLDEVNLFHNIDRALVIQDTKTFNESPLNTARCVKVLTKLFYLVNHGERLSAREATDAFFAITKAFQSKDPNLRRLVYLAIKELATSANDVIMVISSLQHDMNIMPAFKACALRALGMVVDSNMITGIERAMKQAIADKSPSVVSAALVTATHLFQANKEAVKRWLPEIQASLQGGHGKSIAQYHALGLLYLIRQNDRMALSKLVQQMNNHAFNPLATCLHLRIYGQLLNLDSSIVIDLKPFLRFKGKNDMVALEAARVICEHPDVHGGDLTFAISSLQAFLSSPKPLLRFASIRLLNELSMIEPKKVAVCNVEIENLVKDSNRNVATLAITTLLKTGSEASVDRLITQITGYVSEISDEFRIIVVDAVRALSLKFPHKHKPMIEFLGNVLREEGGLAYKEATVTAICDILAQAPSAREAALAYLCEFIEDSEYPRLTAQILHLLGEEGPKIEQPSRLVRFIFNRLVLEGPAVRLASIGGLIRLASACESLRPSVISILQRSLEDEDDQVRDRAVIGLELLAQPHQQEVRFDEAFDFEAFENQLQEYMRQSEAVLSLQPFDVKTVPRIPKAALFASTKRGISSSPSSPGEVAASQASATSPTTRDRLSEIPELATFGTVFSRSKPVTLTDPESEYAVNIIKHVAASTLILEFECRNTVRELALENVQVKVHTIDATSEDLKPLFALPVAKLAYDEPDSCFVIFTCDRLAERPGASFECTLSFVAAEVDPNSGVVLSRGGEDEYPIEGFDLALSDYVRSRDVPDFESEWQLLGEDAQSVETLQLPSMRSLNEAVRAVADIIGARPHHGTGTIEPGTSTHTLLISGSLFDGSPQGSNFAVRARFAQSDGGIVTQLAIRSLNPVITEAIIAAIC